MIRLGFHMSIAGSVANAPLATAEKGYTALQIFTSNPRSWKFGDIDGGDAEKFRKLVLENDLRAFAHVPYLSNPSSSNPEIRKKSTEMIIKNIGDCNVLGIKGLVIHIGSHLGAGVEAGMENIIGVLKDVVGSTDRCHVLLENSSGYINSVGSNFEEIGKIIDSVGSPRVGVCLDTCHAFAAGYDFRSAKEVERIVGGFDSNIGLKKLGLVHLNDSRFGLGEGKDRHWHIGMGEIGEIGFVNIFRNKALAKGSFIMETPVNEAADDVDNFRMAQRIIGIAGRG
jgi:deoxyribonuclease IV